MSKFSFLHGGRVNERQDFFVRMKSRKVVVPQQGYSNPMEDTKSLALGFILAGKLVQVFVSTRDV